VKRLATLAALAALILLSAQAGLTQAPSDDLRAVRKEIEALREGQAAIQKELQEIKNLLRARPAVPPAEPQNIVLSVADAPFKGEKSAKLTLIDFSDYQ
jgi:type II secretory pathway component PulM